MGVLQDETAEDVGSVPRCQACGSERVAREARACWNTETGLWELERVGGQDHCQACDGPTELVWSRPEAPPKQRIRELNDRFRREGRGNGSVMVTAGLQAEDETVLRAALAAMRAFDAFTEDNDPWGEHDFGALEIAGRKIFWKIDYYAPDLRRGSENPANEALTHRVLTLMLASEY